MLYDEFCQNQIDYDAHEYYDELFKGTERRDSKLMKDFMDGILESIFETGDMNCLVSCVEQLSFLIDQSVKIPAGEPKIERKRT